MKNLYINKKSNMCVARSKLPHKFIITFGSRSGASVLWCINFDVIQNEQIAIYLG